MGLQLILLYLQHDGTFKGQAVFARVSYPLVTEFSSGSDWTETRRVRAEQTIPS